MHNFCERKKNCFVSEPAAGESDDYMLGVGGANLSYTIELPGKGKGDERFVPEPFEIVPVGAETFEFRF